MYKRIGLLCLFFLTLGLFTACSSPARQLDNFAQQLSALEAYTFSAVGEITFESDTDTGALPLRYVMEGVRSSVTGQFIADIHYTDPAGRHLYDMSLFAEGGMTHVRFVPLFQRLMDIEYAEHGAASVSEAFGGSPYLAHPTLDVTTLLADLPALVSGLDAAVIRDGLVSDEGGYTLRISGEHLDDATFAGLTRPFGLFFEVGALAGDAVGPNTVLPPLLAGDRARYTLELTFSQDGLDFHSHLTLTVPGLLTLTADVRYSAVNAAPVAPPTYIVDMDAFLYTVAAYHADMEIARLIDDYELEFIVDLPELHMVNHDLSTNLLENFEMEIGGKPFEVSVMSNAVTTASEVAVYSVSSAMTVFYMPLDARALASDALISFILIDLDVEDLYAENFTRTDVHINAHNTAAVKALHFDDLLVGPALHIYVLQNIEGTDQALFLRVVVILDNMTTPGRQVLERLGFYIGLEFLDYLDWAAEAEADTEDE
ncbi:MAG: hypothetical protein FWE08_07700 [Oscillospiraceae bacterium]|nr:hypothetical protein [Oscillospiraceae bacterium]